MSVRQTFAFKAAEPVEGHSASTGRSAGAQIVGGESRSGIVTATRQTDPVAMTGGLGEFFGELMQPYVARKQQEKFFDGFVAAAEGKALAELSDSGSAVTKIFGPTSFAEGAQFYTARKAVTDYSQAQLADMDNLKKLAPSEVSKMLAERARGALTGDPYADQIIQRSLIEQAGPLVDTIAKKRVEWQQSEAVSAWSGAADSSAGNLQTLMGEQATVTDPSDPRRTASQAALGSFLGGMAKPEGMTDESYRKGLYNFMRGQMQGGNFFAVEALRRAGIDGIFDDEEQVRLEDAYHRYSQRTLEEAASQYLPDYIEAYEVARVEGHLSPMEAGKALASMNGLVRSRTGIDEDLFNWKEIKGEVRSMAELAMAAKRRKQERDWQLEDRAAARQMRREEQEQDVRETAAAVGIAWAQGDVNGAIAGGLEEKHFNRVALAEYRNGNLSGLTRAFRTGQYVSPAVRNDVQALVAASVDEQYGKSMELAHKRWQGMVQANPGMAAAYYGEWHQKMRAFDTLSRQLGPQAAYTRSFGDTARYSATDLPAGTRKAAQEAIASAVAGRQPGRVSRLFGATPFNPSAVAVITGVATDRVALGLKNSDTPASALAGEAINAALADGTLQTAGGFAWRAVPGTKPFHAQLGLQPDEAGAVFRQVLADRLKRRGFAKGLNADAFSIAPVNDPQGKPALAIIAHSVDGTAPAHVYVPIADFKAAHRESLARQGAARAQRNGRVGQVAREMAARGFNANRPDTVPRDWRARPVIRPELLN